MAMSKMADLRKLSVEEMEAQIQTLKRELFELRFQKATRESIQTHQFKHIRHQIAQLMTLQQERR
ncbi:MAG: 50S ribosomal protein L29 [Acaryochloris sp. RU_4_1]|nr:50S ribosomal protein L29 [Acaryochloris sp. RU_4_1]NJR54037.1 50S ribosomal protein L29 [Acaryochloris sp. CRU_2_0]